MDRGGGLRRLSVTAALVVALASTACASGGTGRRPAALPAPSATTGSSATTGPANTSPPSSGPPSVAPTAGFLAFGDFGGGSAQRAVATAMEAWVAAGHRVDALVTTGDNVYEVATPRLFRAQLDEPYRKLRAGRPLWATLGNHDVAGGFGDEELTYLGLPRLPYTESLTGVEFLFLDANHPDDAQARWLDQRLSEPGPPFRVVVFHQPAWSCGLHGSTADVDQRWVPVIERHRVALVLNGHDHDYERFLSRGGVTYVVTGGGGRELYPVLGRCVEEPAPQASAVRHHFVAVQVEPHALRLVAVGDDGAVFDQAVVER